MSGYSNSSYSIGGALTEAEAEEQLRTLPPGVTQAMVDAAFESLGCRISKLEIKRALHAANLAREAP